jgi:peptidoglycan hydrolase-like protein with peptidoglycan-binding domain
MNKLVLATIIAVSAAALPALAQQTGSPSQLNRQPQAQPRQTAAADTDRDQIRQVQQALDQKGFKAGRADGVLGARTKQALQDFQTRQKLQANGQLDQQTLAALGVSTNSQSSGQNGAASTVGQGSGGAKSNAGSTPSNQNPGH